MEEESLIKTIVTGADWQEILSTIILEQNLDPMNIDISKLSDRFMNYINAMKDFDFRIPARFILIASILLTMKCEKLLEEEERKLNRLEKEQMKKLDIDVPIVVPPIKRDPTRKVTLTELISALNKVVSIKERKERIIEVRRESPHIEIEEIENIENRMEEVYTKLKEKGIIRFSDLVATWKRKEIIRLFLPVLALVNRGTIECEQEDMFKDIYIKLR